MNLPSLAMLNQERMNGIVAILLIESFPIISS